MRQNSWRLCAVTLLIVLSFLISGCEAQLLWSIPVSKAALDRREAAAADLSSLRQVAPGPLPSLGDDLDLASLNAAIEHSLAYFDRFEETERHTLGSLTFTVGDMKETLRVFRDIMNGPDSRLLKEERIQETFNFYQAVGNDGKGGMLLTGYYEPLLNGSLVRTERFQHPLYKVPEETVVLRGGVMYGEMEYRGQIGRWHNGEIVPHYRRDEIDGQGVLTDRNLEIAWVADRIDLFFLHVQGSGKIRLPDGSLMHVGFAQSNGYPYRSIGDHLISRGIMTKKDLTLQSIKKYLLENPGEVASILNHNERYIFFRVLTGGPIGALGVPITAGRTIASDLDLFPRGALALIKARKPVIQGGQVVSWNPLSRFVLNQDAGAALKGPGRMDLFCGSGDDAEAIAGRLKEQGTVFFLMKKQPSS